MFGMILSSTLNLQYQWFGSLPQSWPLHPSCGFLESHCQLPVTSAYAASHLCRFASNVFVHEKFERSTTVPAWNIALKYSLRDMRMLRWRKRLPPSHLTVTSEKLSEPFSWQRTSGYYICFSGRMEFWHAGCFWKCQCCEKPRHGFISCLGPNTIKSQKLEGK